MRFAYHMGKGDTLAWARRLHDEHSEILVYHADPVNRRIGDTLVPIARSREEWIAWGARDPQTIYFFDSSGFGALADRLRTSGKLVVGGGEFCDRLEEDRPFGQKFADDAGIAVPPTREFGSVSSAVAYMRAHGGNQRVGDGGWAWKPNRDLGPAASIVGDTEKVTAHCERMIRKQFGDRIACIVQERVPGVALSTARWWNGRTWTGPIEGTLEEKKFMDGDVGPATGCALNTVWFYLTETPRIAQALQFDRLAAMLRARNAPPGPYDVNAIVNDEGAWYLEWTARLGLDADLCVQRAISNLSTFLYCVATGGETDHLFDVSTLYHGVNLTIPPYPTKQGVDMQKSPALGVPVENVDGVWDRTFIGRGLALTKDGLEVVDPEGYVGMAFAADTSVERGYARIAKAIEEYRIPNLQYRTDGAKIVLKDLADMRESGWESTPYLEVPHGELNPA